MDLCSVIWPSYGNVPVVKMLKFLLTVIFDLVSEKIFKTDFCYPEGNDKKVLLKLVSRVKRKKF